MMENVLRQQIANKNQKNGKGPTQQLIQQLFERLKKTQYDGERLIYYFNEGLYSSDIKLNIISKNISQEKFGQTAYVPDNNMFATNFVLYSLILCQKLGTISFDESYLQPAIDALLSFQNKNVDPDVPMYTFWPQVQDPKTGFWVCTPSNLYVARSIIENMPEDMQKLVEELTGVSLKYFDIFTQAFKIPPDNDDTGINVVLGSLLRENKKSYPNISKQWNDINTNYKELYRQIKKYAYKPFSDDINSNSIDPRTYYYLRDFIYKKQNQAKDEGKQPKLMLFSTWITNLKDMKINYDTMPIYINNVDATVNANSLYGLVRLILTPDKTDLEDLLEFYDQEIRQLITDVTDFLVWAIESEIILKRPDLSLTYYPSEYDFYWFTARIANFLNESDYIPFKELQYCQSQLNKVLQGAQTRQLLDLVQQDKQGNKYWESFLGNFKFGKKHLDRAFSTATALNSLLDIYTKKNPHTGKLVYIDETSEDVKETIQNAIQYLSELMSDEKTSLQNTLFSGSVKSAEDNPYFYPSNACYIYWQSANKRQYLDPAKPKAEEFANSVKNQWISQGAVPKDIIFVQSMSGVVSEEQYTNWVENYTWWNYTTPTEFNGFNQPDTKFPYWSSKSTTLSFSMLAFSKYLNLD